MIGLTEDETPWRKLRDGIMPLCIVIWPLDQTDYIMAKPSIIQYSSQKDVEQFIRKWPKRSGDVSVDALIAGSSIISTNGAFQLTVRKQEKESALLWARRNHPISKFRWATE